MGRIGASARAGVVATIAWVAGCGTPRGFACLDDEACGGDGRCEASGYCSFPDAACPSQRRYGEHAPASLAGMCVEPDGGATGTTGNSDPSVASTPTDVTGEPTTAGTTATSEVSTEPITATSDGGDTPTDDTAAESSSGGQRIVVGPMLIEEDLDDGSIWPAAEGIDAAWRPSGESRPGLAFGGEYPVGAAYFSYFRFHVPVALPAGSVVTSASFEVDGWTTYQWSIDVDALEVWVEADDDAAQVSGVIDHPGTPMGRPLTDASTRWPNQGGLSWNTRGPNASPELVAPIQEALDLAGGFDEGDHVQLWIGCADLGLGNREVGWRDASGDGPTARLTLEVMVP